MAYFAHDFAALVFLLFVPMAQMVRLEWFVAIATHMHLAFFVLVHVLHVVAIIAPVRALKPTLEALNELTLRYLDIL